MKSNQNVIVSANIQDVAASVTSRRVVTTTSSCPVVLLTQTMSCVTREYPVNPLSKC